MDQLFKKLTSNTSTENFITCTDKFLRLLPKAYLGRVALFVTTDTTETKSRLYSWLDRNELSQCKIKIVEYRHLVRSPIRYQNWYRIILIDKAEPNYLTFIKRVLNLNGLINKTIRFIFLSNLTTFLPPILRNAPSFVFHRNWRYTDIHLKQLPPGRSIVDKKGLSSHRFDLLDEGETHE